ncbi:hypothetical protein D3C87_1808870 [compost metagenome]
MTPSTTYKGCLLFASELIPRICMLTALEAPPGAELICTPGALPYSAEPILVVPACVSSLEPMVVEAYPKALASLLIPIAVTTTSSNAEASSFKVTLIVLVEPTIISDALYPMIVNRKVSPCEA